MIPCRAALEQHSTYSTECAEAEFCELRMHDVG
jgi:hypothetical protein